MPAAFSGERIVAARKLFGLTQIALADAVGVSQGLISQVEKGTRGATEDLIGSVALALGMPRSFFDVIPPENPLDSLRFRKNSTASKIDTERAKVLFKEAYRVSSYLVEHSGFAQSQLPRATSPVDREMIFDLALQAREALRVNLEGPVPHVTRLLERAGIPCAPLRLPGQEALELPTAVGHFGMSYWAGPGELAVIGYFPGSKADRDRFTLAHELGHVILHAHNHETVDPESEANFFAGAFLMPPAQADDIFDSSLTLTDYARLKQRWGISIQALIMHANNVGKVSDDRKRSLFTQLSARGWRKSEPVKVYPEEPRLLWKLISKIFGSSPYYAAVDELALPAVLLRSLAPYPARATNNRHDEQSSNELSEESGYADVVQFKRKKA
ncbi:Zn-dependent peptidase ImmA, M78 family [Actinopolyspora alba]|uniref:Zn-dependent peptidase ImmA, M78 family n=2 Tax=Actinopolyspora alba TaxID=673379 RepID=A0A1I1YAE8_9ACTN|nr:Zn-dependent peptidase ImmA, M78 family [Actinopolyspora alba]